MAQMRTLLLLRRRIWSGGFTGRNRIAAHRILESGRREDKSQLNRFIAGIFQTYPGIRRNKHKRARMDVAFLVAEKNMSLAGLNQQDFILVQVLVLLYGGSWREFLCTRNQMLRAIILWAYFQHELRGSGNAGVGVNAASPQLAFILFQDHGLDAGL